MSLQLPDVHFTLGVLCPPPSPCVYAARPAASSARKPAGKLGLGVKKLDAKVDQDLFNQVRHDPQVTGPDCSLF